ncbi:adherens junction-associated protein 1 isoform X2 [Cavia porcellus]|uniref:adherens junction-associated protein 1 isoform X2 n=1 Tax=Cavia porcellus TaxID=10141 RepID=UPI002FE31827
MWIQQLLGLSSMSIRWPGRSLGSHAWILIAMLQLAVDFPSCESLGPGPEFRLMPRPAQRPPRLWSLRSGQPSRPPTPMWTPRAPRVERAHGQMQVSRARRAHRPRDQAATLVPRGGLTKPPATAKSSSTLASSSSSSSSAVAAGGAAEQQSQLKRGRRHAQDALLNSFDFRGSRPTTETEFIAWGPTGDEEPPEANTFPGLYGPTTVSVLQTRKTTVATTTTTTTATSMTLQTRGLTASLEPWRKIAVGVSTTEPSPSPSGDGTNTKPPRILGETSAVPKAGTLGGTATSGRSTSRRRAARTSPTSPRPGCPAAWTSSRPTTRRCSAPTSACGHLCPYTPTRRCTRRASTSPHSTGTAPPPLTGISSLWPSCLRNGLKSPADWPKAFYLLGQGRRQVSVSWIPLVNL